MKNSHVCAALLRSGAGPHRSGSRSMQPLPPHPDPEHQSCFLSRSRQGGWTVKRLHQPADGTEATAPPFPTITQSGRRRVFCSHAQTGCFIMTQIARPLRSTSTLTNQELLWSHCPMSSHCSRTAVV